ncbi:MAG: hypothetical protein L3K26_03175, partial [Candidatus Hydrogenedentes bacterium]|nr:hypothetical protein [Candidatus Hydrogenedentota bacterium]
VAPSIEAKQRFGRALDLYCAGSFGEALVIFDALMQEFPESMEIEKARHQCIEARNRDPLHLPGPDSGQVMGDVLDENTLRSMRRIVVEKMLHGATEPVQLQAAELVARMGGVLDTARPAPMNHPSTEKDDPSSTNGSVDDSRAEGHRPGGKTLGGNDRTEATGDDASLDVDVDEVAR